MFPSGPFSQGFFSRGLEEREEGGGGGDRLKNRSPVRQDVKNKTRGRCRCSR